MKSLSQQMLTRKRDRVEKEVRAHVTDWLKHDPFYAFVNKPTVQQVTDMFMAARFGPGEPLTVAGDLFAFEYILDEVCVSLQTFHSKRFSKAVGIVDPV
jgi:hypothetical protein